MTTRLSRMRLSLDGLDADLLVVGDTFDDGGRYMQQRLPRADTAAWDWLDWEDAYDRLRQAWLHEHGAEVPHRYLSTACHHAGGYDPRSDQAAALHGYCQADTGQCGAKTPGVCKFCAVPCVCPCHGARS